MSLTLNTQHIIWILLAAVAITIFIFWAYRQLMVQLSSRTGWGLTLVRIGAVGMLLFTICEPAASIVITAATPIMMPSIVRQALKRLALIDCSATRRTSPSSISVS